MTGGENIFSRLLKKIHDRHLARHQCRLPGMGSIQYIIAHFHLHVLFLLENKNSNLYFRTKKAPELFLKADFQWAFDANEYI